MGVGVPQAPGEGMGVCVPRAFGPSGVPPALWLGAVCEDGQLSAGGGAAGEEPPALLTQSSFSRRRTENFCASSFTGPPPTSPRRTTLLSEYTGAGAATWRVISLPNEAADAGLVQDTQTAGPPATQPPRARLWAPTDGAQRGGVLGRAARRRHAETHAQPHI